jgi:hypothetical protein
VLSEERGFAGLEGEAISVCEKGPHGLFDEL